MSVLDDLRGKASQKPKRIVLPEADDARVLAAAVSLAQQKIAVPVLVGNPGTVARVASQASISVPSSIEIHDPSSASQTADFAAEYYGLRKDKGLTQAQAREEMLRPLMFG